MHQWRTEALSPYGIAEPPDQSLRNSGNECWLARALPLTLWQKCVRYPPWKIFAPLKSTPKFTKSLKICYAPMPLIVPNFIALGQTVYGKSATICLHSSAFWRPKGTSWAKVHQFRHCCTARRGLLTRQISSLLATCSVYEISAAELYWFRWKCIADRRDRQKAVNDIIDMSPRIPCGDKEVVKTVRTSANIDGDNELQRLQWS